MSCKVKICGINSIDLAKQSIELGADSIGLIIEVGYSKFDVNRFQAKEILHHATGNTVMVTVLDTPQSIIELSDFVDTTHIQITQMMHAAELSEIKNSTRKQIIYTVHVVDENSIEVAKRSANLCDYILLDSGNKVQAGGTGISHDWSISKQIVESVKTPVILAGGLTPENVKEAINIVKPYGVDVSSGVATNGKKDLDKIKKFIKAAKDNI